MPVDSARSLINSRQLDVVAAKNLEGFELAKQRTMVEKSYKQKMLVLSYLKKKLPYGDVKLELINSLSEKEFNRFLVKAQSTHIWEIVWPGIVTTFALLGCFMAPGNAVVAIPGVLIYLLAGALFGIRLMGITETEEENQ